MRQLILAGVCALSAVFVAVKFGALAIAVLAVGALAGALLAFLLRKSKVIGAFGGVVFAIILFVIVVPRLTQAPRCDFGDPADLPILTHPAGYVYVIQDIEFSRRYKIGRTTNPDRRINEIRTILPGKSDIVAIVDTQDAPTLEWQLHQRYVAERKHGEWFELSDEQVREICSL